MQEGADGRDEHQQAAGHDTGADRRPHDPAQHDSRGGAQVESRLGGAMVESLGGRVDRQDHERQERVRHAHEGRSAGVEHLRSVDSDRVESRCQRAGLAQDHDPGVGADQHAGPERDGDGQDQHRLQMAGPVGDPDRGREADGQRDEHGRCGQQDRRPHHVEVGRIEADVAGEVLGHDEPLVGVGGQPVAHSHAAQPPRFEGVPDDDCHRPADHERDEDQCGGREPSGSDPHDVSILVCRGSMRMLTESPTAGLGPSASVLALMRRLSPRSMVRWISAPR